MTRHEAPRLPLALPIALLLAVYAESLVAGRRVAVIAPAGTGVGDRLVEMGARVVHIYDPTLSYGSQLATLPPRGAGVSALPPGEFEVRDGAYDVVLVADFHALADRGALLVRLRRLVHDKGAVLLASKNPDVADEGESLLDYYELYDLATLQFASVRMVGEVPFSGVTIAELGEGEGDGVSVDTQLAGPARAPEYFIVVLGQRDVGLPAYVIVELPDDGSARASVSPLAPSPRAVEHLEELASTLAAIEDAAESQRITLPELRGLHAADEERTQLRSALVEAQLRGDLLQAQLEEQRARAERALAGATARGADRAAHEALVAKIAELEKEVASLSERLADAESRAGDHYLRFERVAYEAKQLAEELEARTLAVAEISKGAAGAETALAEARVVAHAASQRAQSLEAALLQRNELLEQTLAAAAAERARFEAELAALSMRNGERVVPLARERDRAVELAAAAADELARERRRGEAFKLAVERLEADVAGAGEAFEAELMALEALLRERGQAIKALERELAARERMVHELLAAVEERGGFGGAPALQPVPPPANEETERLSEENGKLRRQLDQLALENARREAELQASGWRVSALEGEVSRLQLEVARLAASPDQEEGDAPIDPLAAQLARAEDELDVLRRALAQEHEARRELENGALSKARGEIERQAQLIEKLSREIELHGAAAGHSTLSGTPRSPGGVDT